MPDIQIIGWPKSDRRTLVINATAEDVEAWRATYIRNRGRRRRLQKGRCRVQGCRKLARYTYDFGPYGLVMCEEHAPTLGPDGQWVIPPGVAMKPHLPPERRPSCGCWICSSAIALQVAARLEDGRPERPDSPPVEAAKPRGDSGSGGRPDAQLEASDA